MPDKVWTSMNDLQMVTSKICSAREIIDAAIDRLQEHQYDKAETMMSAAYEYLEYYLQEFDEKFQTAWEIAMKLRKQQMNLDYDEVVSVLKEEEPITGTIPIEGPDENGDFVITIPDVIIGKFGWQEGDILEWVPQENGSILLRAKKENQDGDS